MASARLNSEDFLVLPWDDREPAIFPASKQIERWSGFSVPDPLHSRAFAY